MNTPLTQMLGVRYPIIQGGMQWVGYAELAAAVSNAGGLGILTALTQPTPEALAAEITRCRALTDQPFGVNVTMLRTVNAPPYAQYFDVIIKQGIKIVETAGNVPEDVFATLKKAGIVVVHKCTSVRHAIAAQRRGAGVISIDGFECAGHPGEDDVPGLVLIPAACDALEIPVVASGGIADGRGMAAALSLGAVGVNMGTRFVCTQEAPVHADIKAALMGASERDTRLIFRTMRNSARVLDNVISRTVIGLETRPGGVTFDEIRPLVAGVRGKQALASGAVDDGLVWAGQVVGLINDIPTCQQLISRMVSECKARLTRAMSYF